MTLFSIRTNINKTTKISPYEILFGRFPNRFNSISVDKWLSELNPHIYVEKNL